MEMTSKEVKKMRIIVETYDYGVKYTDIYRDMNNFRSNIYANEGYFVTCDDMIIDSKNIKCAYPEIKELEDTYFEPGETRETNTYNILEGIQNAL